MHAYLNQAQFSKQVTSHVYGVEVKKKSMLNLHPTLHIIAALYDLVALIFYDI